MLRLVIPGIQAFLLLVSDLAVGIRPRGISRIQLLFLCRFFAHLSGVGVSRRRGGDASIGLREELIGFQIELPYRLKEDT